MPRLVPKDLVSASPTDRFRRVDAVFDAVLDLPTAEQAAFIDRACSEDPELRAEVLQLLRAEVLQLLRAHHHSGGILDTPVARLSPLLTEASDAGISTAVDRVGPFRIERAIGEGGMGQVLLAAVLGITDRTVRRDWAKARAYLNKVLYLD